MQFLSSSKLIYAATGINQLLTACIEGMTFGADINREAFLGGTRLESFAAGAFHNALTVLGMDVFFHYLHLINPETVPPVGPSARVFGGVFALKRKVKDTQFCHNCQVTCRRKSIKVCILLNYIEIATSHGRGPHAERMILVKVKAISPQEYTAYLSQHPRRYFYNQSPQILAFDRAQGLDVEFIGFFAGQNLQAACKLTYLPELRFYRKAQLNWLPLGPEDIGQLAQILEALEAYLKDEKNVLQLSLSPLCLRGIYKDDEDYQVYPLASQVDQIFQNAHYQRQEEDFYQNTGLQPRYIFVKDLKGQSEEEVLASLDSKVRNHIRVAERYGMTLRKLQPEEADVFNQALTRMADNYGFPRNRLNLTTPEIINAAGDTVRYLAICLRVEDSLELNRQIEADIKAEQAATDDSSRRGKTKIRELDQQLVANDKRRDRLQELADQHGKKQELILGVSQFALSPSDYICFQTAIFSEFVDLSPAYYMHGVMLKEAVAQGADYYNLFAVSDPVEPEDDLGVLNFKKQFNGQVEEYVGTYSKELANPALAKLLRQLKALKNRLQP